MQAKTRVRVVAVDQTGFGPVRQAGDGIPEGDQRGRNRGPWPAGFGMAVGIAVAGAVGQPAQRAAIAHPHRHGFAAAGHRGAVEWRLGQQRQYPVAQDALGGEVEMAGQQSHGGEAITAAAGLDIRLRAGKSPAMRRQTVDIAKKPGSGRMETVAMPSPHPI